MNLSKKDNGIDLHELTPEDLAQYRKHGKRRLIVSAVFFCLLSPILLYPPFEIIINRGYSPVWLCPVFIVYALGCFGSYIIYFAGKPRGIRYGRISRKIPHRNGKFYGYKFNVYFEDIHKSMTDVIIPLNKEHPTIRINDGVKVIKSRFGALYMICFNRAQNSEIQSADGKK